MNNGDLILLDFTAKVKDTGDLIETTIEEEGKKIGDFDEHFVFKPRLVAVGDSWVLKGLDEAAVINLCINLDINTPFEVEECGYTTFKDMDMNNIGVA